MVCLLCSKPKKRCVENCPTKLLTSAYADERMDQIYTQFGHKFLVKVFGSAIEQSVGSNVPIPHMLNQVKGNLGWEMDLWNEHPVGGPLHAFCLLTGQEIPMGDEFEKVNEYFPSILRRITRDKTSDEIISIKRSLLWEINHWENNKVGGVRSQFVGFQERHAGQSSGSKVKPGNAVKLGGAKTKPRSGAKPRAAGKEHADDGTGAKDAAGFQERHAGQSSGSKVKPGNAVKLGGAKTKPRSGAKPRAAGKEHADDGTGAKDAAGFQERHAGQSSGSKVKPGNAVKLGGAKTKPRSGAKPRAAGKEHADDEDKSSGTGAIDAALILVETLEKLIDEAKKVVIDLKKTMKH